MTQSKALPRGGVLPPDNKSISLSAPIANAAVPPFAVIPMLQHLGRPAECVVKSGDHVSEGMIIGSAAGDHSASVHASIPGRVVDIRDMATPGFGRCRAVAIELGGEFEKSGKPQREKDWEALSGADLLGKIRSAGIVGLGGQPVPSHLKLAPVPGRTIALLVANGVGAEPSLAADHALMREKPREIAEGLRICRRLLGAKRVVLTLGEDADELVPSFERLFDGMSEGFKISILSSMYPQGHEELVVAALKEDGSLPAPEEGSSLVLNVATLLAVYEGVVLDKPLIERVVTVTGRAVRTPRNLKVRFGTRVGDLFEECGGLSSEPGKVVLGGPMRGTAVESLDVPVTKGVGGIVAFAGAEALHPREWPCVRCGSCAEACPWGLVPNRLYKLVESGGIVAAVAEGLHACTECGCCAYVCPSRIPLVAGLRRGLTVAARGRDG